jgi:hypothetical protein
MGEFSKIYHPGPTRKQKEMFCYYVRVDIAGSERLGLSDGLAGMAGASAELHDPVKQWVNPAENINSQKLDPAGQQQAKIKPMLPGTVPPEHCWEQKPVPGTSAWRKPGHVAMTRISKRAGS